MTTMTDREFWLAIRAALLAAVAAIERKYLQKTKVQAIFDGDGENVTETPRLVVK